MAGALREFGMIGTYFKNGCKQGYVLKIGRSNCVNGNPYFIGGNPVESIKLKVLGIVPEEER